MASINVGPSPARARATAAAEASYIASGSLPFTVTPVIPYASAREEISLTFIDSMRGVNSPYSLFWHTKITGSFHTAARFSASCQAPMFVAPSPK